MQSQSEKVLFHNQAAQPHSNPAHIEIFHVHYLLPLTN